MYPEPVQNEVDRILLIGEELGVFRDEKLGIDLINRDILRENLSKYILPKWLNNDYEINDIELNKIFNLSLVESSLNRLKKLGLVDGIEDKDGEEVFWITPKGKEELNSYLGK